MGRWRVDVPAEIAKASAPAARLARKLTRAWADGLSVEATADLEARWRAEDRIARRRVSYLRRLERRRKTPAASPALAETGT